MPWSLKLSEDARWMEWVLTGHLAASDLAEAIGALTGLAREHGIFLILCDASRLLGGHSIVDLFELASQLSSDAVYHAFREAVVLPHMPQISEDARFWETASINRGLTVKVFPDRPSALAWLLEPDRASPAAVSPAA